MDCGQGRGDDCDSCPVAGTATTRTTRGGIDVETIGDIAERLMERGCPPPQQLGVFAKTRGSTTYEALIALEKLAAQAKRLSSPEEQILWQD